MKKKNTVFEFKNYGKVQINLKQILDKQCMSRNELATSIGVNFDVINRWYANNTSRIDRCACQNMFCFKLQTRGFDNIQY